MFRNICLIGMPYSGKSFLSRKLYKPFNKGLGVYLVPPTYIIYSKFFSQKSFTVYLALAWGPIVLLPGLKLVGYHPLINKGSLKKPNGCFIPQGCR